ncbi:MAG: GNAT family N-acetyltransferase [Alphaproteobacteria bacterium]
MSAPAPAITVRAAGPLDVSVIFAMHADCFTDGLGGQVWDQAAIAEVLALPGAYGLLAVEEVSDVPGDGVPPAGFVLGRAVSGECEILSLGVPRYWRRRGLGRVLLRAAVACACAAGARRAFLEVAEDNDAARRLYLAEGFAVVARWPAYYRRTTGETAAALVCAREVG